MILIPIMRKLTFIVILGGDSEYGVLDVFVFINLRLVQSLVKVGWIVILVSDSNSDEFGNCGREEEVWC